MAWKISKRQTERPFSQTDRQHREIAKRAQILRDTVHISSDWYICPVSTQRTGPNYCFILPTHDKIRRVVIMLILTFNDI